MVTEIGPNCLNDYLKESLTSVTIPSHIRKVHGSFLAGATNLRTITFEEGLVELGEYTFMANTGVTSITLPSTLRTIGRDAFQHCDNLTTITIPNGVTEIPKNMCVHCDNLETVNLPNSVTSIGESAFWTCPKLAHINMPTSLQTIGTSAFQGCAITSLTLPSTLLSVGVYAFYDCPELTSVTFEEGLAEKEIQDRAFNQCHKLASVTFPSTLETIGSNAFNDCALTSITLPDGLKTLGESAFGTNPNLASANYPLGMENVGSGVFYGCGFTSFTFPEGVTTLPASIFSYCRNLSEVNLPESLETVGDRVFEGCALTSVTIPQNVTTFYCSSTLFSAVSTLILKSTTPPTVEGRHDAGWRNQNGKVIVPAGTLAAYEANEFWGGTYQWNDETLPWVTNLVEEDHFTLSASADAHGSVTWPTNGSIKNGSTSVTISGTGLTLTFVPDYRYALSQLLVNGVDVTNQVTNRSYTLSDVTTGSTVTVAATFAELSEETITLSAAEMGTFCSDYDLDFSTTPGIAAYIATGYNTLTGKVTMGRVYDVPAGTGLFIRGEAGSHDVPLGTSYSYYVNLLVGLTESTVVPQHEDDFTNYTLQGGANGIGFYLPVEGSSVARGKSYLHVPNRHEPEAKKFIRIAFEEDEATGIQDLMEFDDDNTPYYSITGQKTAKPQSKGIYIHNGRKVLIR